MPDTVLIAEDSDVIRILLRTLLEEHGLEIIEAPDGQAALDSVREHRPDAVLMDVEMPHLNGYEVMREMQKDPELSEIPVVFLTARSEPREMAIALEAGGHDYLSKPFETPELLARVTAALHAKRTNEQAAGPNAARGA